MTPLHGCLQFRGDYFLYAPLVGNSCGGLHYFHVKEKTGEKTVQGKCGKFYLYRSVTTLDYDLEGNAGSV